MSRVQPFETAIAKLKPKDVHKLAEWLNQYREELWDRQLAAAAETGRLDSLISKAKSDYRQGKATPFP